MLVVVESRLSFCGTILSAGPKAVHSGMEVSPVKKLIRDMLAAGSDGSTKANGQIIVVLFLLCHLEKKLLSCTN